MLIDYSYNATNKSGTTVTGTIQASSREEARAALRHQNLRPLHVAPASKSRRRRGFSFQHRVRLKELVIFTRQLSTMVSAGVALNRSLATLEQQAEGEYFKKVLADVSKEVQSGKPLGEAFGKYPNIFNDVYVNMVKAGEAGGILEEILHRLASQIEKEASIKKKIKSAMTYPSVIMGVTVIGFFTIMLVVIPKIGGILKELGGEDAQLPVYTRAMLSISNFIQHNALFIFVILGLLVYAVSRYIRTPKGKYALHALLLRVPVVKTVIIKIAIARFARTFASLMSAGVGVLDALEVTGGAIGNKVIEKELQDAAIEVKNGKQLSEPLSASKHFPPIVGQMLAVGEETGKVDEILVKVADFYEEEVSAVIDALSSLIEPLMIIVLGGVVGLIAASVMGPIAGLSKNIQSNN